MSIETQVLQFDPFAKPRGTLSALQIEYFTLLRRLKRIDLLVEHYMQKGLLVHFRALSELLRELSQSKVITNPELKNYFTDHASLPPAEQAYQTKAPSNAEELAKCPFFKSLPAQVLALLWNRKKLVALKSGQTLFQEGEESRDLYLTAKGWLGLYRKTDSGGVTRINDFREGAVFGEGGFLLGQPRAGTVRALVDSEVLTFSIPEMDFNEHLNVDRVKSIQPRLWALNSVLKSETLRLLPAESIDQLVFSGELRQFKEGENLFREGDTGKSLFIVINGSAVVSQGGKSINVMKPGDSFGEIALFFSGEKRTATVHCQSDCTLLEIKRNMFYSLLQRNIALGAEMEGVALSRISKDKARQLGRQS